MKKNKINIIPGFTSNVIDELLKKKKGCTPFKSVLQIIWDDSMAFTGWKYDEEIKNKVMDNTSHQKHKTIGFFLDDSNDSITLMQTINNIEDGDEERAASNFFKIPKGCITEIKILEY